MVINRRRPHSPAPDPGRRVTDHPETSETPTPAPVMPSPGEAFVAVHRLSNAEDETLAEVGETCERVPEVSLQPLLASGHIRPKDV